MRKIAAILSILFLVAVTQTNTAKAQVNVQINIGSQPAWGPTGYDYVQYYYFPDYDFYYDINRGQYIIFNNNVWSYVKQIPGRYRFDPYNAYKVVVNQNNPYLYNKNHRNKYVSFKGQGAQQPMIRDSRDTRYYESKGHPNHSQWISNNGSSNRTNNNKPVQQNQNTNNRNQTGQTTGGSRNQKEDKTNRENKSNNTSRTNQRTAGR